MGSDLCSSGRACCEDRVSDGAPQEVGHRQTSDGNLAYPRVPAQYCTPVALALACWHHLGSILGPLGSILGHLGSILTHLGSILGHLGPILAPSRLPRGPQSHLRIKISSRISLFSSLGIEILEEIPILGSPEAPRATLALVFLRGFHFLVHLESKSSKRSQFLAPRTK